MLGDTVWILALPLTPVLGSFVCAPLDQENASPVSTWTHTDPCSSQQPVAPGSWKDQEVAVREERQDAVLWPKQQLWKCQVKLREKWKFEFYVVVSEQTAVFVCFR